MLWRRMVLFLIAAGSLAMMVLASGDPSALAWKADKTVDANISNWPFQKMLARLSAVSGWKIFVEPGLTNNLSVRFKNLPQGEALKLLVGGANYAWVPRKQGPARLYVFRSDRSGATALVSPDIAARPTNWLDKEIIITISPEKKAEIEKLAAELGAKIVGRADEINSYRLEFDSAEAAQQAREKLAAREDLETSDNYQFNRPNVAGAAGQLTPASFGLDPSPVSRGDQVTVALIDTAVQPLEGKMKDFVLDGIHLMGQTQLPDDMPTHGTSMLQTMLNSMAAADKNKSAGKVRVLPIDIYGNNGMTTTFEVAQGLQAAIRANAQVVNLSLGGTGYSPLVEYLLEVAYQKQMLVYASAGNTPTTEPTYPAASPRVIGVTAADRYGNIAPYANYGDFVDVKAPGTSLVRFRGRTFISTGTSTSTAGISGESAAYWAQGFTPQQISQIILNTYNVNNPPAVTGP